jgi:hypothetical protein
MTPKGCVHHTPMAGPDLMGLPLGSTGVFCKPARLFPSLTWQRDSAQVALHHVLAGLGLAPCSSCTDSAASLAEFFVNPTHTWARSIHETPQLFLIMGRQLLEAVRHSVSHTV